MTIVQPPAELPPEIVKALPGTIGAIVALRWIEGSPLQRVTAVLGGGTASWYGSEHLARGLDTSAGLAGFLIGLFGMAIASKVFEMIAAWRTSKVIERILGKLGL